MDDLLRQMQALSESRDTEDAHSQADELLLKALRMLGKQAGRSLEVGRLIDAYHLIDKWYA